MKIPFASIEPTRLPTLNYAQPIIYYPLSLSNFELQLLTGCRWAGLSTNLVIQPTGRTDMVNEG